MLRAAAVVLVAVSPSVGFASGRLHHNQKWSRKTYFAMTTESKLTLAAQPGASNLVHEEITGLVKQTEEYERKGNYVQATENWKRLLMHADTNIGPMSEESAVSLSHLGNLYFMQGEYNKSASAYSRILSIDKSKHTTKNHDLAPTLAGLARADLYAGRPESAEISTQTLLKWLSQMIQPLHQASQSLGRHTQIQTIYLRLKIS